MYSHLKLKSTTVSGPAGMLKNQPEARFYTALLDLWEASVRVSHLFLTKDDIGQLRPVVAAALHAVDLTWLEDDTGLPLAFMGVDGEMIEMLFVAPHLRGAGLGSRLIGHAIAVLGATRVDVNEQNPRALDFYQKKGFRQVGRSATDGQGRKFPILHLALAQYHAA